MDRAPMGQMGCEGKGWCSVKGDLPKRATGRERETATTWAFVLRPEQSERQTMEVDDALLKFGEIN